MTTNSVKDGPNRREHYRISYPQLTAVRPLIRIAGSTDNALVINCSEMGIRYLPPGKLRPIPGEEVAGRIQFHSQPHVDVRGVVLYIEGDYVAMRLTPPGIPLRVIIKEQHMLLKLFPDRSFMDFS